MPVTQGLRSLLPGPGNTAGVDGGAVSGVSEIIAASLQASNFANNTITSSQLSLDLIQHTTVALSSANLLAMYATPVQLIAAGAAGTNIVVHKAMFTMIRTATAYAAGGVVVFQIGNTANGAGTATTGTIAASVLTTAGAATTYNIVIPVAYAGTAATGLFISNQTAAFTTGTGTAIADIWYSIQ